MITSHQIAKFIEGELVGDKSLIVKGAIDLLPGHKSYISFLDANLNQDCLNNTKSDLIIISKKLNPINQNQTIIKVSNPRDLYEYLVFIRF